MMDTPPLATPRSIEMAAPNSSDTWISSIPSAPMASEKKPPPPKT